MCEFKVFLDGKKVMEDVIYAAVEEKGVVLRDILGETRTFDGVLISEVNVTKTRLVLAHS